MDSIRSWQMQFATDSEFTHDAEYPLIRDVALGTTLKIWVRLHDPMSGEAARRLKCPAAERRASR
jgi:hypothetical protein